MTDVIKATHVVANGKLKHNAYLDGTVARDISTGRVLAMQSKDGKWNKPVREIRYKAPLTDYVKPVGPAVQVVLTKGRYY